VPYERRTVRVTLGTCLAVLAGLSISLGATRTAHAQPKPKVSRACGVTALPLSLGNEWTYTAVAAPADKKLPANEARLTPRQPLQVVIQVVSVETQNDVTKVTLSEDIDGRKLATTITCTRNSFQVSPESFFFAGEPGAGWNVTLADVVHKDKGNTLQLTGGRLTTPTWRDDIAATWAQAPTEGTNAKLGKGRIEMERVFTLQPKQQVQTAAGLYNATEVLLEITGRVNLEPSAAGANVFEMPANFRSHLWFVDGVGLVQVLNGYAHMYQLASVKLTK